MAFDHLTPNTARLLQDIWKSTGSVSNWSARPDQRLKMVAEVGASGERSAIPCLFGLLFDSSAPLALATSDALHRLISQIPLYDLPGLDEDMRATSWWMDSDKWSRLNATQVSQLPKNTTSRSSILGLASFHRSGYVREAAVQQLDTVDDGSELPFLVLRLNDWVEQVRTAADGAVSRRLLPERFEEFARCFDLIIRLTGTKRASNEGTVGWVINQMVQPQHVRKLHKAIEGPIPSVRRKCFGLAVQLEGPHQIGLIWDGLHSKDVVVRLRAAQKVRQCFANGELTKALSLMEQDRFMPVRREALLTHIDRQPETASFHLEAVLMDRNAALRELARFYLIKMGRTDFASTYRRAMFEGREPAIAIAGLGETGTADDLDVIRPALASATPRRRIAAIRAMARLGGDDVAEELLYLLADGSAKATHAAQQGLENRLGLIEGNQLWAIFQTDPRPHVRCAIVELLDQTGSWEGLPFLLRVLADSDTSHAENAKQRIWSRFNSVFTDPSPAFRALTKEAIVDIHLPPDDQFLKGLQAWLRSRGFK